MANAEPTSTAPKFDLGQLVATAAVHEAEDPQDIAAALDRHVRGDWGDLDAHDVSVNNHALADPAQALADPDHGGRLLSSYVLPSTGHRVWVITEADRSVTTVLYPHEY
jgi:hypothetical protein